MKKLFIFLSVFMFIFTLSACDQLNEVLDDVDPVITGAEDVTLVIGSSFTIMDGIVATDDKDGDITDDVTYTITDEIGNPVTIDLNTAGLYIITYSVSDKQGNTTSVTRRVTINESGVSDDIIHVLLGSVGDAEARLNQFYFDVLQSTLSATEVCEKYIGDVPFPINNTTVDDCVQGVSEVKSKFIDFDIVSVIIINYEGNSIYQAEVTLYDNMSETRTGMVEFAFLTKQTLTQEYIHFYGDPFLNDGGGDGRTLEEVQMYVQEFYDSFFDVYYDASLFCQMSALPVDPLECENAVEEARSRITSYQVTNLWETEIIFPDGNPGFGYYVELELVYDNNPVVVSFDFFLLEEPNTGYVIGIIPLDDFTGGLFRSMTNFVDLPYDQAIAEIRSFYNDLMNPMVDITTFCQVYVDRYPFEGPTVPDCEEALMNMRTAASNLTVDDIYMTSIEIDYETYINGYHAMISYDFEGERMFVEIPFAIVEDDLGYLVMLFSDPLGMENQHHDGEFIYIPIEDAMIYIDEFYLMIEDHGYDLYLFCDMYMQAFNMYDPEFIQGCVDGLQGMRNVIINHMIYDVSHQFRDDNEFYGDVYIALINIDTVDGPIETEVMFGFVDFNGYIQLILLSDPLGNMQPIDTVVLPEPDAFVLINDLYNEMIFEPNNVDDFCYMYIERGIDGPSFEECVQAVSEIRSSILSLNITNVMMMEIDVHGQYVMGYQIEVEFDLGNGPEYGYVDMILVPGEFDPLPVFMSHPLGFDDGPGGFYLIELFIDEAELGIMSFYDAIMDPNVDLVQLCSDLMMAMPMEGGSPEECAMGFENLRQGLVMYMILNIEYMYINDYGMEGTLYTAEIEMHDIHGNQHIVFVQFGFVDIDGIPRLVILSNPGWGGDPGMYDIAYISDMEAEAYIIDFYNQIFNTNVFVEDLCMDYVSRDPYGPSFEECFDAVNHIRMNYGSFTIGPVYPEIVYLPSGQEITAWAVNISLHNLDGGTNFDLPFFFVNMNGMPQLVLNGHPAGINDGPIIVIKDPVDVLFDIELFYNELFNQQLDPASFCQMYILPNPMTQFDPLSCEDYVLSVRQTPTLFVIEDVIPEQIPAGGGYVDGYHVIITFHFDGNEIVTTDIMLAYILDPMGNELMLLFTDELVVGMPSGSMYANINEVDAFNLVNQFLMDITNPNLPSDVFCQVYLMLDPTMIPMDHQMCIDSREMYVNESLSFLIDFPMFYPETPDSPPYFVFPIQKTHNGVTEDYQIMFIFLVDQNGQILPATVFEQVVSPFVDPPLDYYTMDPPTAITTIQEFIFDAFDPTIEAQLFCMIYQVPNHDFSSYCEELAFYRGLDVVNDYLVNNIVETYQNGYQEWVVTIDEFSSYGVRSYQISFVFVLDENGMPWLLPTSPLVIDPVIDMVQDEIQLEMILQQYYMDLFDPTFSTLDFCAIYHLNNPFFDGTDQDCYDGRNYSLTRTENYTVGMVMLETYSPFMIYQGEVFVEENGFVLVYEMSFNVFVIDGMEHIVFYDELIRDVPLP